MTAIATIPRTRTPKGSPAELKERTGAQTLDDVYLHYAGRSFQMANDLIEVTRV